MLFLEYIFKNNLRNIDDYEVFKDLWKFNRELICVFNFCKVVKDLFKYYKDEFLLLLI